jgi:hypothetical protein
VDLDFRRPQRPVAKTYLQRSSKPAEVKQVHKQEVVEPVLSFSAPVQSSANGNMALAKPKQIDFSIGAKAFKKRQFLYSISQGLIKAGIAAIVIAFILGAFGLWLNNKYSGRALPLSYIGDISVAGLTQPEIKNLLDSRAKAIEVKFIDGGLVKTVPISSFGAVFDTEQVSKQAVTSGFSPFAYLNRKSLEVPVTINERQIEGYLRLNIFNTQTKSENAEIIKDKNKLAIKPEVVGFRSDSSFIANRIKIALTTMSEPLINVNAVTLKPNISSVDLEDDLTRANKMIATVVSVKVYNSLVKISDAQKISWLEYSETPGTKNLNIGFNKTQIRQFVSELAGKYESTPKVDSSSGPVGSTVSVNGTRAENIDEVSEAIYKSLSTSEQVSSTLKFKSTSVESVVPATPVVTNDPITVITPVAATIAN